jgi:GNAT superfamily N-acetyltransferase
VTELAATTLATVDTYWAAFFGCPPTVFATPTTTIVPHAALGDYHGLWLFRRHATLIVSVLPRDLEQQDQAFGAISSASFEDVPAIESRIVAPIERVIGPAYIGYADAATFQPYAASHTRLLTARDRAAFERFRLTCFSLDWEHGGSELGHQPVVGCFRDDAMVAAAGYEVWGGQIAHISIVTHPAYRGQGYGKAAVSAIAQVALEQGLIPQYRTLMSNTPSLAIGAALGFIAYAQSIAVRFAR